MSDLATFVAGLRSTGSNYMATDERPKNFREAILWLDPNGMTPLTALSAKMKSETTDDPEFSWWEEVLDAKRAVLANAPGAAGTTFDFDAGTDASGVRAVNPARQFTVGDLVQVQDAGGQPDAYGTVEIARVDSITDDDTIECTRAYAGTAVTMAIGDRILLVGKAFGEGTAGATTKTSKPQKMVNYTQIFKTAFELTNTARQTKFRTGDAFENDRKRAMFNHSESLEQAMFWGIAKEISGTTAGSNPVRLMGGIRHFLSSNVDGTTGAVTEDFFLDTLSPMFDFNAGGAGDQRICFIGNSALNVWQKKVRDSGEVRVNYNGKINFFGLKLLEYMIPQGTFFLKSHPLMNTDPIYTKSMFVLNPKGIINRPLRGRDTKIQKEIQANDMDTRKDQWLTETSMELHHERTMGYYGNILAA